MKHNCRIIVSALTLKELDTIERMANFTDEQRAIFFALNKNRYCDYALINDLNMSKRKFYREKLIVVDKVERIAVELGYNHVFKVRK